jgi:hypothetical protein
MAANDSKYNVHIEGIPDDEPVFVLRAKDAASLSTLFHYWSRCHDIGSPYEHLDACQAAIGNFERWQRQHRQRMKVPD